ncbi:fatty acyl-CoA reductase wat isoform X2 [Monomorium pharaonis]|uniref:fatty acyl-CoA reductase wat isoform X2 n=1 Tax=Monomorium pharaonis TaxID=307658 RepID=UPI001746036A|nr:fatty acyl-CoA reductase wat isoform X2 [Monomorium pharaonis]
MVQTVQRHRLGVQPSIVYRLTFSEQPTPNQAEAEIAENGQTTSYKARSLTLYCNLRIMISERNMETEAYRTPIQNFYAGQSIFITGGSGFLGKVLIEKLLRSCADISTIYLLIRSKKDKHPDSRLDEIFEEPLYDRVKEEVPDFRQKVVPIIGDLNVEDFGLSANDKNMLINEVSIIFHMAANVRFNEEIKVSAAANIDGTASILKLAKHMTNLKSFIHVSTVYANCFVNHIEERFYSYPINHKNLIMFTRNLSENVIKKKISRIMSQWPNIYTFTKAIAEGLLRCESGNLPVGIFRPAIVLSSASEPLVGWIDNMYGPLGIAVTSLLGLTRFHHCDCNVKANIVPVDFTANALIASAWDVFNQSRRGTDMLIYNFVSPIDGPTWNEYTHTFLDINKTYPLRNAIYIPLMIHLRHKVSYKICTWLGHFLPALFMDIASICINRSPSMWKLYTKIDKITEATGYFCNKEWTYSTDNVHAMWNRLNEKDQQLFKFNMIEFNWAKYFIGHYQGLRLYILKDDESTLEISRIKYKSGIAANIIE